MHAISSYRGNRPTNKHTHTNKQTGPITVHCVAKLSEQCNDGEKLERLEIDRQDNDGPSFLSVMSCPAVLQCRALKFCPSVYCSCDTPTKLQVVRLQAVESCL